MNADEPRSRQDETRSKPRFKVKPDILLYNEATFAEILDISEDGLSCRYLINLRYEEPPVRTIDLLNSIDKIYVKSIPCARVHQYDEPVSPTMPSTVLRTCGITFAPMPPDKKSQIREFIEKARAAG